jgi:hypothetical protein
MGIALPILLAAAVLTQTRPDPDRLRVLIETDLGGDADDQASLVRFLLYTNEWDVEGIIADRPAATFHKDPVRDHLGLPVNNGHELALEYLKAYGKVRGNLVRHDPDYPTEAYLRERTVPGHNDTDAGVKLITAAADRDDPRPVWYGNWGSNSGATSNLRRALDRAKAERSPEEYRRFVEKFRIVTLDGGGPTRQGHDEHIQLHIETGYPTLEGKRWYHRFRPLTEYAGGSQVNEDVKKGGGALGALYTTPKEGDSWSFIYLIPTGLSDPMQPTWGGWAGRYGPRSEGPADKKMGPTGKQFFWANQTDTWKGTTNRDNTAKRWAVHLQNDFRARLKWCVTDRYKNANHEPVVHCQKDSTRQVLHKTAKADEICMIDSGATDPDGNSLTYRWLVYPEPGTYRGEMMIPESDRPTTFFRVPKDAAGKTIHVILQVTDDGTPALTRYRRIVITVKP